MRRRKARKIIYKIAREEGLEENEVRREMQKAILTGFMNTETKQEWERLFGRGRLPSPEEFITKVADYLTK